MFYIMNKSSFFIVGVALAAFLIGTFIGFNGGAQIARKKFLQEQNLPVVSSLLTSPVLYEWWASAEGVVKEKTANSMTLEKNGKTTEIIIMATTTFSKLKSPGSSEYVPVSFSELPIGTMVRGGVRVSKESFDGALSSVNDRVMGSSFVVVSP